MFLQVEPENLFNYIHSYMPFDICMQTTHKHILESQKSTADLKLLAKEYSKTLQI